MKCPVCGTDMKNEICPNCLYTMRPFKLKVKVEMARGLIQNGKKNLSGLQHFYYHLADMRLRQEGESPQNVSHFRNIILKEVQNRPKPKKEIRVPEPVTQTEEFVYPPEEWTEHKEYETSDASSQMELEEENYIEKPYYSEPTENVTMTGPVQNEPVTASYSSDDQYNQNINNIAYNPNKAGFKEREEKSNVPVEGEEIKNTAVSFLIDDTSYFSDEVSKETKKIYKYLYKEASRLSKNKDSNEEITEFLAGAEGEIVIEGRSDKEIMKKRKLFSLSEDDKPLPINYDGFFEEIPKPDTEATRMEGINVKQILSVGALVVCLAGLVFYAIISLIP